MAFTIEFDDKNLTERIWDPYKRIDSTFALGATFSEFISLGKEMSKKNHIYFALSDPDTYRIDENSYLYVEMIEYINLCIKLPEYFCTQDFMYFLHLKGLSLPQSHIAYHFEKDQVPKSSLSEYKSLSHFETVMRGYHNSDKRKHPMTTVYTCESIEDICVACLYHVLMMGKSIKRCQNCGNYFVPLQRSDSIYCLRKSPFNNNKTCRDDGAQKAYEFKVSQDQVLKETRKVYQALQMRAKRNPDDDIYGFYLWKEDAAKWKKELKAGKVTPERYMQWLSTCLENY